MTDSVDSLARIRKGIHFFFFDESVDSYLKGIIIRASVIVGIASFILFVYLVFVKGWADTNPDAVFICRGC